MEKELTLMDDEEYTKMDLLLNDYLEQKSSVCYGLLEYFINSGDTSQKYLS